MADNEHEGVKKCTKCGEWKPATAEFFNRNSRMAGGLDSWCKGCNAEKGRIYRASNVGRLWGAVKRIREKTGATIYLRDMTDEEKETLANQYVAVITLEKTEKELLAASGKKRCSKCGRVLDYCCFNKNITKNDGVCSWCKECHSAEYDRKYRIDYRKYYQQNKDKRKEYDREYYQQNKDKKNEYDREYREKNKEKIAEQKREYYEKNKDKVKEYRRKYYEKNKDKIKEYHQQKKQKKALDKTKSIPDNRE